MKIIRMEFTGLLSRISANGKKILAISPTSGFCHAARRGGRVVEGARLESVYRATYREFESHPLRQDYIPGHPGTSKIA